jgi:uncharacterized protein YabE (DUF348 family)
MGVVPVEETHDPRPTGKLFALRWKHEQLRLVLLGAIILFAMTILFLSLLQRVDARNITIVDDGVTSVIQTRTANVRDVLQEHNIRVGPFDRISLMPTELLQEGSQIVIDRAKGITVRVDGKQTKNYTTGHSVAGALQELQLALSSEDRVTPTLDTRLEPGMTLAITRVRSKMVETKHPIAYTVVHQQSADLAEGKQKLIQPGQEGEVVFKTKNVYEDGKLVSQQFVNKTVTKPAAEQIVAVGTKKAEVKALAKASSDSRFVQLSGMSVKVKRMLNNVTLTAYSAGFASTGKNKGDDGYGVTASGAIVREGRTIAVDPRVIPIGWWVYIDGIGFRRAEDTGSAVKGKKIDVYYDSENRANRFGTKRGYTVYVIGPVKPSAD